jgi:transcriptional regulator with XRE-family HTH domain
MGAAGARAAIMDRDSALIAEGGESGRPSLPAFGDFIRQARINRAIRSQRDLGRLIGKSQSFVAQLEAGNVLYPDPSLLQALASHLGLDYARLVNTYAHARFGLSADTSLEKAVGLEIRDVDSLAAWERDLPPGDLWIVVRNFVDQDVVEIQEAVTSFVKRGGRITYFSEDRAQFEGAKEAILAHATKTTTQNYSQMEESIFFEWVPHYAIRLMMSGVVIYNPRSLADPDPRVADTCEAFLIVNDGVRPDFGIRIASKIEKRRIYNNIKAFMSERPAYKGEWE